jgi:CRISPR-associated protein Csd1
MLHALKEYAEKQNIVGKAGFTTKTIRWLIHFTPNGQYLGIASTSEEGDRRGRGRTFNEVPHLKFAGDTPMRQFLVDTAQYALLYGESKPSEKLLAKHNYFLSLLKESSSQEPFLGKVARALSDEAIRKRICEDLRAQSPKAKASDNVSFVEIGTSTQRIIVESDSWRNWWRNYFPSLFKKKDAVDPMRCFLSGEMVEPCLTHPKIKGLGGVGGNVETTLIGFDKDAFRSYGLPQSANAAMGSEMAEQYAAALNKLIASNSKRLAGSIVVYWYTGDIEIGSTDDVIEELFGGIDFGNAEVDDEAEAERATDSHRKRIQAESRAGELLEAIRTGKRADLKDARYCALILSGNAGRVVVRDWIEGQFEELAENTQTWFNDLSIIFRDGNSTVESFRFNSILAAPVRELKDISAALGTTLFYSAVKNGPIPYSVMAQTLRRATLDVIQDQAPRHARYGLLKAFCNRTERVPEMKRELNEYLEDPAYLSGRIMALLAAIQKAALPDVGAGIVQRYYAAASATPGLVLGRLVRVAQTGHLPKITPDGLRIWFDKQLASVWQQLKQAPPASLTLEEQTLFAMGYYQQKAQKHPADNENKNRSDE